MNAERTCEQNIPIFVRNFDFTHCCGVIFDNDDCLSV